jgi:hypothetical protein
MSTTAVGDDYFDRRATGCWCCGDRTVVASLLQLDEHREVGVCFRCVDVLAKRKRAIEHMTRKAPPGPWWRRLQFRAGFNRC